MNLKRLWDKPDRYFLILGLLLAIGLSALYSQLIETDIAGMIPDDGVYAILGKALATGQGYHLIHLVSAPAHLKYPILYPAVLAVGWLLQPKFPQNLAFLTQLNIGLCVGAWILLLWYFSRLKALPLWLAGMLTLLVGCNYFLLYYGTSLMSESLYLLLSVAAMAQAEASFLQKSNDTRSLLIAIVLSSLLFHTRLIGLAFMMALSLMLIFKKQWKPAVLYILGSCVLTILPWSLWTVFHQPSVSGSLNPTVANVYSNYSQEWINIYSAGNYLQHFFNTLGTYTNSLMENMFPIVNHFFDFYPFPNLKSHPLLVQGYLILFLLLNYGLLGGYLLQGVSCLRQSLTQRTMQFFSLPGLYLTFYSIAILGWGYDDQTSRFLSVLMPWFWYYLFKPILPQRLWGKIAVSTLLVLLALAPLPQEVDFIRKIRTHHWMDLGKYPMLWDEYQATFYYIRENLPSQLPLGAGRDVMFYLYTGHPTFHVSAGSVRMKGNQPDEAAYPELMESLDYYHVSYLIVEPQLQGREVRGMENLVARGLIDHYPNRFQPLYRSPFGMLTVFKILPPMLH